MKTILFILFLVLVAWFVFVKGPEAKCASIAKDYHAAYSFSAVRGCEIRTRHMTWLLTPDYLRNYQVEP